MRRGGRGGGGGRRGGGGGAGGRWTGASPPRDAAMHLPACFASLILTFAPVFMQRRTWRHAELLLIGAILAPGKRTVTSLLRIAGLGRERRFATYHRVLNRAAWSPRTASLVL